MNNISKSLSVIFAVVLFALTSCKKDNPQPEVNQEEFDKTELIFVELDGINGQYHEHDTALTVSFDASGKPNKHHYHIKKGTYRLYINLYSKGVLINQEILDEADEHQFFFNGAPTGVLNYTYEDNVGLKGILEVLQGSETFDLNVVLRHGIRKTTPMLPWNSSRSEYAKAGGTYDLNVTFELHPFENEHIDDAHSGHSH